MLKPVHCKRAFSPFQTVLRGAAVVPLVRAAVTVYESEKMQGTGFSSRTSYSFAVTRPAPTIIVLPTLRSECYTLGPGGTWMRAARL